MKTYKNDPSIVISDDGITLFQNRLLEWSKTNLRRFPWRETKDFYPIFVAEFLLQQTDAPRALPVYERFLNRYQTINELANADPDELGEILQPLGFHFRALRLQQAALQVSETLKSDGHFPSTEEELLTFPGVGPYMARSICANAFDLPTAVLDTNIIRIIQRFFGLVSQRARPRNDRHLWAIAQHIAPTTNLSHWNLTLIDFGAAVCTARGSKCKDCPLYQRCIYAEEVC